LKYLIFSSPSLEHKVYDDRSRHTGLDLVHLNCVYGEEALLAMVAAMAASSTDT